jgi:hypothetical protein
MAKKEACPTEICPVYPMRRSSPIVNIVYIAQKISTLVTYADLSAKTKGAMRTLRHRIR